MSNNTSPLKKFYRVVKTTVRLPSRGLFYEDGVVNLNDEYEVNILPMTAADELILKNPDALLSGQSIVEVIRSCVPAVKKPTKLLSCDIDTLMVGIRDASYGDDSTMEIKCPSCGAQNTYGLNLEILLNQTEFLKESYSVDLEDNLKVYVRPGTFESVIKQQKTLLDNKKIETILGQNTLGEEEKLKLLAALFNKLGKLNYELILDSVIKVDITHEDGEVESVTNRTYIEDFLKNIDKGQVDKIEVVIRESNSVGIQDRIPAVCTSCSHEWEAPIEFNPVNFS